MKKMFKKRKPSIPFTFLMTRLLTIVIVIALISVTFIYIPTQVTDIYRAKISYKMDLECQHRGFDSSYIKHSNGRFSKTTYFCMNGLDAKEVYVNSNHQIIAIVNVDKVSS